MQHIHERGHNLLALSDDKAFKDSTKVKLLNIKAAYFFNVIENGIEMSSFFTFFKFQENTAKPLALLLNGRSSLADIRNLLNIK